MTWIDQIRFRLADWLYWRRQARSISREGRGCGALVKSLSDPFTYAMGLRTGLIIRYMEARPSNDGRWIHLVDAKFTTCASCDDPDDPQTKAPIGLCMDHPPGRELARGIDVRVSDIVWAADAPEGS